MPSEIISLFDHQKDDYFFEINNPEKFLKKDLVSYYSPSVYIKNNIFGLDLKINLSQRKFSVDIMERDFQEHKKIKKLSTPIYNYSEDHFQEILKSLQKKIEKNQFQNTQEIQEFFTKIFFEHIANPILKKESCVFWRMTLKDFGPEEETVFLNNHHKIQIILDHLQNLSSYLKTSVIITVVCDHETQEFFIVCNSRKQQEKINFFFKEINPELPKLYDLCPITGLSLTTRKYKQLTLTAHPQNISAHTVLKIKKIFNTCP